MIVAETALGRMTKKSPVGAYESFGKSKWLSSGGWINAVIPILIVPYYSVIGGWVIKYLAEYLLGHGQALATDEYFSAFISNGRFHGDLLYSLHPVYSCYHLRRCTQRDRACIEVYDADPRGPFRAHRGLFRIETGRYEWCEISVWYQTLRTSPG